MENFSVNGFIIDIVLAAVIVISVIRGWKKGFVSSAISIVSFAAAFVCAWIFTPVLSPLIYKGAMLGWVESAVEKAIEAAGLSGSAFSWSVGDFPAEFVQILERFGIEIDSFLTTGSGAASEDAAVSAIAGPTAGILSNIAAYTLIFLAVALAARILAALINGALKIVGLSSVNRFFGGCLGALCGFFYAAIIAVIIRSAWPSLCAAWPEIFSAGAVSGSMILELLEKYSIFAVGRRLFVKR